MTSEDFVSVCNQSISCLSETATLLRVVTDLIPGVHRTGPRGPSPGGGALREEALLQLRGRSARRHPALHGHARLPQGHWYVPV